MIGVRGFRLASATLALAAGVAGAQTPPAAGRRCELEVLPAGNETRMTVTTLPNGQRQIFMGQGFVGVCAGQDIRLRADSAEYYESQAVLYLIGNVHYTEPRAKVDSRRMTYFRNDERLVAEGDVVATLPSGTTMRGPQAEYFRAVANMRPNARLVTNGRPRYEIIETDSTGKKAPPVTLVANQVITEAESVFFASGKVEIDRTDISARADSATMDRGTEFARLMRKPSITGKGAKPFTLRGGVIDLFSRQRQLERVLAKGEANAISEDMDLKSDTIDLRVFNRLLERAFAWGKSRAHVTSPSRDIVADSLDISMPGQRVREVRALGSAFAQTDPDSTKLHSDERDWLRGDTITAQFDSAAAAPDTSRRPKIRALVANGRASSLYQVPPQAGGEQRPSINYVRGRVINVAFRNEGVDRVTVVDQAAGIYLEAAPDTGAAAAARPGNATGAGAATSDARPAGGATTTTPAKAPAATTPKPTTRKPTAPATGVRKP
ncbi:MAG TPA: hypothetical protein VKA84_23345 [Gemmatimonadaceae bacterium]|nr:hypothetical protein [Gemmatimonadaceae bacterium]